MNRDRLLSFVVLAAVIITICFPFLAESLSLFGTTIGEVSKTTPARTTPADYAFAIWSVIYAGLLAFAIYQVRPANLLNERLRAIRPYVIVNLAANILWLLLTYNERTVLNVASMLVMLLTLIIIYTRLQAGARGSSLIEKVCVEAPFSIYFGWITVATIANTAGAMVAVGWNSFGLVAEVWTALLIIVALLIAAIIYINFKESAYPLVFAWAFAAIAVANEDSTLVLWTAVIATICIVAVLLFGAQVRRKEMQTAN